MKDYILVEINCLTNPVPHETRSIQSYISQYLNTEGYKDMIVEYDLQSFNVKVLSLWRTLFEKILSLNRLSYDGIPKLVEKARHFYDIHKLLHHPDIKDNLMNKENFKILKNALEDDNDNETMAGEWKGNPLSASPLFSDIEAEWAKVAPGYRSNLQGLIWDGNLPGQDQILSTLKKIQQFISVYDRNPQ